MKIKRNKLLKYLAKYDISEKEFINSLELSLDEHIKYSLGGNILNEESSRKFLNAIGADHAIELIDWEAMNIARPRNEYIFAHAN